MRKCDGCGTEFDDSVELYPRLVMTSEAQVARRLAEKEEDEEEMLCLGCWLEAVDDLDKKQLAMLLLGMLKKINSLEERIPGSYTGGEGFNFPSGVIEKLREEQRRREKDEYKWGPYPTTHPNPIWIAPDTHRTGDFPGGGITEDFPGSTKIMMMGSPSTSNAFAENEQRRTNQPQKTFLCGSWSEKVQ